MMTVECKFVVLVLPKSEFLKAGKSNDLHRLKEPKSPLGEINVLNRAVLTLQREDEVLIRSRENDVHIEIREIIWRMHMIGPIST